jgi:hypothetical protein
LEVFGFGQPLIPDPGRLIYDDGPDRKWLQSTRSHNTICVNAKNHAAAETGDVHLTHWEVEKDHIFVACYHDSYRHLPGNPLVGRSLWFDRKGTFIVVDWAHATEPQQYSVSFILPVEHLERTATDRYSAQLGNAQVFLNVLPVMGQEQSQSSSFWSPNYGERLPAARLEIHQSGKRAVFASVIQVAAKDDHRATLSAQWAPPLDVEEPAVLYLTQDGSKRTILIASPFAKINQL